MRSNDAAAPTATWQHIVQALLMPEDVPRPVALGIMIRKHRRRAALTLGDLSHRTGISKPYLSLIETGRNPHPPSDEKLLKIEQAVTLPTGSLVAIALVNRTPDDVRDLLVALLVTSPKARARADKGRPGAVGVPGP